MSINNCYSKLSPTGDSASSESMGWSKVPGWCFHYQGRQTGAVGGSQPPLNFGWGGVEHLSTPPDFEKIFIKLI